MAASATAAEGAAAPLSFADFLEKMKDPAAADLVRNIKGFIRHFDERSSKHIPNLDTDSAAVQDFFIRMESMFRTHPSWRGAGPEVIDQAIEGLEKYVMSKIWPRTFAASSEDRDRDERYFRLARALSFVNLTTLMGGTAEVIPDEGLVATAVSELTKMDRYKAPRDKLLCLVNVKTLVEDIVGEAVRRGASIGGADAFFPVFLLVVVHARLPRLASNIDYIRRFRARARLNGQFDYMLCNLESAAMYLDTADWQHLGVTREFFLNRLADAGIPEAAMELKALEEQEKQLQESLLLAGEEETEGGEVEEAEGGYDYGGGTAPVSEQEKYAAGEVASQKYQPLLSVDVPETLGGETGVDLKNTTNLIIKRADATSASASTTTADGLTLTPLGAGPQTPLLVKKQLPTTEEKEAITEQQIKINNELPITSTAVAPEQESRGGGGASGSGAQVVIDAMVADGTPLVIEEESEGRLQQRHPWIYAAAEDLNITDVRSLLAGYRDLVLKYEAITLSLQQQVNKNSGGGRMTDTSVVPSRMNPSAINQGSLLSAATISSAGGSGSGNFLLGTAPGSGSISESAGALIQKLASWGASKSPSGRQVGEEGSYSEAAAALQGKAAGAGVDTRLLQSLFGSSSSQQRQQTPSPQLDLLGDLETEVKVDDEGGGGENKNGALGSPALGLIEETPQPPFAGITESLI
jgi:Rab5 GDP/GTP exchange factor